MGGKIIKTGKEKMIGNENKDIKKTTVRPLASLEGSGETQVEESSAIELRSEAVQEILGRPPRWIIRWGITLLFIIVGGLLIGSYFFSYPEIISARMEVTSRNLPVPLVTRSGGRIDTLFVEDKQAVTADDHLAIIANPASYRDVQYLKKELHAFQPFFIDFSTDYFRLFPTNLQLGDLQPSYFNFLKSYKDYGDFMEADYHRKKIDVVKKQIEAQQQLQQQSRKQLPLQQEQLAIAATMYRMDSTLYAQRNLSLVERERTRSAYLQSLQSFENMKTSLDNMRLSILQLEQSIFDIQQQGEEQRKQLQITLLGAFDNLQNQLVVWEQSYVITSPIDGTVALTRFWQKNQHVQVGEILLTVVPYDNTQIIGKIYLPVKGAGKVKNGQDVNIKLDNFPFMEYGMIRVKIENISAVPVTINQEKQHIVEVQLPTPLKTNYGAELAFTQEMQGTAEIITDNRRLLERLIQPVRSIFTQYRE